MTIAMLCNSMSHKPICSRSIKTLQCLVNFTSSSKMKAPEITRSWQWPQAFKANAQELTTTSALLEEGQRDMYRADVAGPFDIEAAFRAMRRRHAQECQSFVFAYQRQCAAFFEDKVHPTKQLILLEDRFFVGSRSMAIW